MLFKERILPFNSDQKASNLGLKIGLHTSLNNHYLLRLLENLVHFPLHKEDHHSLAHIFTTFRRSGLTGTRHTDTVPYRLYTPWSENSKSCLASWRNFRGGKAHTLIPEFPFARFSRNPPVELWRLGSNVPKQQARE